jgi:death on curing protein
MIDANTVLAIHSVLIEKFGGGNGVRDYPGLLSALARPYATFDNVELYPDVLSKASALIESIVYNHPFIDGNKRTGWVLLRIFLIKNKLDIYTDQESKYNFVIQIASGNLKFDGILNWLKENTKTP